MPIPRMIPVVLAWACSAAVQADPPDAHRFHSFLGVSTGDRFGAAVAMLSDLDGDARVELLIGAPGGLVEGERCGYAQVISGLTGEVLKTHTGLAAGDEFGFAVAGLWDVDNDEVFDYAVGAPGGGYVRIYSGKKLKALCTIWSPLPPAARFGHALSLNLVGHLAVGAPLDDSFGTDAGSVRTYKKTQPLAIMPGQQPGEWFGYSVHYSYGNGPFYSSLLVGAPNHFHGGDHHGKVYLMGADGSGPNAWWIGPGEGSPERLGSAITFSVWQALDTTYERAHWGAPGEGGGSGYVYWLDPPHGGEDNISNTISAGTPGDGFGSAIAALGFIPYQKDPLLAVGAPRAGALGTGTVRVLSMYSGEEAFRLIGSSATSEFGASLSGKGDVDGDDWRDLLVGEPGDGPGAAHVYRLLVPAAAGTFLPGHLLDGEISATTDTDEVAFEAMKGTKLRLWAQGVPAPVDLRVRLFDPQNEKALTWKVAATGQPSKKKVVLKKTGTWRLVVSSWKEGTGRYRLFTEQVLPKGAAWFKVTGKASKKTGALELEFTGVAGSFLDIDVEPTDKQAGPAALTLINPDGAPYENLHPYFEVFDNWTLWWNVPLAQSGKYRALVYPADPGDELRVDVSLDVPNGWGVILID